MARTRRTSLPRPSPASRAATSRLAARGLKHGRAQAHAELARRMGATKAAAATAEGVVVAEGDSWFDYPGNDVLDRLEDAGFRVAKVAHAGDRLEEMAYHPQQAADLVRTLRGLAEDNHVPRALMLSGGGNDIAGTDFHMLLNHVASGLPALNAGIVNSIIGERLMFAYGCLIGRATAAAKDLFGRRIPVLIHGYAHPVPDGRGFWGGGWFLPGPWLQPGFERKGHEDLPTNTGVMVDLIDRFNEMAWTIPTLKGFEHVTYIDLRPELTNELAHRKYRSDWDNELHPTKDGFEAVAAKFVTALRRLPLP